MQALPGIHAVEGLIEEQDPRIVDEGGEPMNVIRDPARNQSIEVPRYGRQISWEVTRDSILRRQNGAWKHSPIVAEMVRKYLGEEALLEPIH